MCVTCGCSGPNLEHAEDLHATISAVPAAQHEHSHEHPHAHEHHEHHEHAPALHVHAAEPTPERSTTLRIERALLDKNQRLADANRAWLSARGCVAFNLMGSPGAGKTALLEALAQRAPDLSLSVIEGDQATERDAERIRRAGCRAIQINTGIGCHLDAHAVAHALQQLAPGPGSRVVLENVGNLVCPALFDLGESARIVVLSVTEGDDKPLKYPHMFRACDALVLSKIDLLPYVDFQIERALGYARQLNPALRTFQVSATRGDGLSELSEWIRAGVNARPQAGLGRAGSLP